VRLSLRAGGAAIAALLAVAFLAGCGSASNDSSGALTSGVSSGATTSDGKCASMTTLNTSLVQLYPLIKVGTDAGIFAKYCLVVHNTPATSPVAAIPAILGGSVDLTLLPVASLIATLNDKIPLKIVAPGASLPDNADALPPAQVDPAGVFVSKASGITSPKQLAGQTVAVPGLGTSIQEGVIAAAAAAGGDPSKINWVQLDSQTEVQQLEAGKIAAAAIAIPYASEVEKAGYKRIASPTLALYGPGMDYTPWVTSASDLAAKGDAFKRFREAIIQVQEYSMAHVAEYEQAQSELSEIPLAEIKQGPSFWYATQVNVNDLTRFAGKMKALGFISQVPDLSNVVAAFN
jgi:ABC-type nitrate/sulfonate/bicarbonate transport system substrate-binding protein